MHRCVSTQQACAGTPPTLRKYSQWSARPARAPRAWQIPPRVLIEAINGPDHTAAKRAFDAMMTMRKIDVAKIEAAMRGEAVNA